MGVDPTVAVETPAPEKSIDSADPGVDVYDFKEYELKEDAVEGSDKALYDYDAYNNYGTEGETQPTSEDEFGPGVPAQTDITESNVSKVLDVVGC